MTPTSVIARLRRLAEDWRREEARLCEQFGDMVVPQSMRARQIKDTQAIDAAVEMIERVVKLEPQPCPTARDHNWYYAQGWNDCLKATLEESK